MAVVSISRALLEQLSEECYCTWWGVEGKWSPLHQASHCFGGKDWAGGLRLPTAPRHGNIPRKATWGGHIRRTNSHVPFKTGINGHMAVALFLFCLPLVLQW